MLNGVWELFIRVWDVEWSVSEKLNGVWEISLRVWDVVWDVRIINKSVICWMLKGVKTISKKKCEMLNKVWIIYKIV